ncbi:long-chain-acyl-CoA synthetase [Pseudomonas sp. A46]|nr:long-chain-acyl-CoA synthetase [Pseudomonas sp. A46]OWJ91064.1 long-chain-acyl-CoA synthetase [Pseudomonas sp. A46]
MPQSDARITWGRMIRKAPFILRALPRVVRGLKAARITHATQPCGLGLAFERATERNPHGAALLYEDRRASYAQVNEQANRLAHFLARQGIAKGSVVALFLENRPELLVCILAVAKLGAVSALLNTSQTQGPLVHSINLVRSDILILGEELLERFEPVRERTSLDHHQLFYLADGDSLMAPGTPPAGYRDLAGALPGQPAHNPDSTRKVFASDPCFYLYTSGTTGLPKAGVFSHGRWMKCYGSFGITALDMQPGDVLYSTLPLYHSTALCVCWASAISGASAFAIGRRFSATHFWDEVRRYRATTIGYVGELCRYLLAQPARSDDRDHSVTRMIGNGLRPGSWRPFKARFGIDRIFELYGSSEGNIGFVNLLNFEDTVGLAIGRWALVEYDHQRERPVRTAEGFFRKVPTGSPGLLLGRIDEKSPLDGYTDPEKTDATILQHVFEKGDRYFNTGDLMRHIGFGHVQFVDRIGDTFRWKGENVSTTEVENLLVRHPAIAEAVVYGVTIPGTNGRAGMAAISLSEAFRDSLELDELLRFARDRLPGYAIPLFLRIRPRMETTGTFKYQKKQLKQEGFDPGSTGTDLLYAWLPGTDGYTRLDDEIHAGIMAGQYRY